jgi:cell pole-organizing protein PopZ
MSDQVAVLESIRDVLSGKIPAQTDLPISKEDEAEILDLTMLVNDDGSITDLELGNLEILAKNNNIEQIEEEEMANVSTTAGDDVLDEIDKLLAGGDDSPAEQASVADIDAMFDTPAPEAAPVPEPATEENVELELREADKMTANIDEPTPEPTTEAEVTMTETDEALISEKSADKAKSAISDLLKLTGKEKLAEAPSHPSPSFRNGDTVEDLVMESLKPMLAKWLDENLNSLVEEIIQKEISKIIPK